MALDSAKAFDSMSHQLIEAMLRLMGMEERWIRVIINFTKGPVGFLVGQEIPDCRIHPARGIKQVDTLSPAIYALVTTSLIQALKKKVPGIKMYLYADDTMIWIQGIRPGCNRWGSN